MTAEDPMVRLRRAQADDAALLFEWANDADVRRWSFASRPIPWPEHVAWMASVLDDPHRRLYIAEVGGAPVGQVRLDATDEGDVISVGIAPMARGSGIGVAVIRAACKRSTSNVVARIKTDNHASIAAFQRVGFACSDRSDDHEEDVVTLVWTRH